MQTLRIVSALAAAFILLAFASSAQAQTRTFACGKGRFMTLTVTGPDRITARPIEGGTITLRESAKDRLLYVFGDYSVRISPDQTRIEVHIADFGTLKCSFQQAAAPPPPPPPAKGCEEGFRLVNGQCQKLAAAVKNPCGPGLRPVPETDRCVPVGTSKTNELMPVTGKSLGGIVRAEPNMASARVASLPEGEFVQILESTHINMDGYDWFKIEFKGRTGYQWGGIMCSDDPLPGIFQKCER